jgi:hypothetical protein
MAKLKEGDLLTCEGCGLVVSVDEACGCATTEIICCGNKPMVRGKAAASKAKKKSEVKAAVKATGTSVKAKATAPVKAAKKTCAKMVPEKKAPVKKAPAKKPGAKAKK